MSSQINTQFVDVQRILVPSGKGISTNISPSLTPMVGSLATDSSTGGLYMGDGTDWITAGASTGVIESTSESIIGFEMTLGGQPSFTGPQLQLFRITIAGREFKFLTLKIQQEITITGNGTWYSPSNTIPVDYRPAGGDVLYFPITSNTAAGYSNTSYVIINTSGSGSIGVSSSAAAGALGFYSFSCMYP